MITGRCTTNQISRVEKTWSTSFCWLWRGPSQLLCHLVVLSKFLLKERDPDMSHQSKAKDWALGEWGSDFCCNRLSLFFAIYLWSFLISRGDKDDTLGESIIKPGNNLVDQNCCVSNTKKMRRHQKAESCWGWRISSLCQTPLRMDLYYSHPHWTVCHNGGAHGAALNVTSRDCQWMNNRSSSHTLGTCSMPGFC